MTTKNPLKNLDTPINTLSKLVTSFVMSVRQSAYPEIDLEAIFKTARESNCCPLPPKTDEVSLMSWPEFSAADNADKMVRTIATKIPEGSILSQADWDKIQHHFVTLNNAMLPALILKAGLHTTLTIVPQELYQDEFLGLMRKNGWTTLEAVAHKAKELRSLSSPTPV